MILSDVKYPAGQDVSVAFSGDENLNVYSGDFVIDAFVKTPANASAGSYPVKGTLRFQACDHSACYPPRNIPVEFQVTVVKQENSLHGKYGPRIMDTGVPGSAPCFGVGRVS